MSMHPGTERGSKLSKRERTILALVRSSGGRARYGKLKDGLVPRSTSQHTMERDLERLIEKGFLRRDPPGGGRGWKGKYVYVPPEGRRASALFYNNLEAVRGCIAKECLPEDAPIDRQAEELAGLLLCLFRLRGQVLASLLREALEVKTDEGAIHWFMAHAGYLEELTDDTSLLAVLSHRPAAKMALEISQRRLERMGAAPTLRPSSSMATRTTAACERTESAAARRKKASPRR